VCKYALAKKLGTAEEGGVSLGHGDGSQGIPLVEWGLRGGVGGGPIWLHDREPLLDNLSSEVASSIRQPPWYKIGCDRNTWRGCDGLSQSTTRRGLFWLGISLTVTT